MVEGVFAGLPRRILVDLSTSSMSPNFLFTFRNYNLPVKSYIIILFLTNFFDQVKFSVDISYIIIW